MERAGNLGYRTLPDGTQLFGRVPHVAPQAWLHALFPPISDREIDQIEGEMGAYVPDVFRDFLNLANGFRIFSGSLSIYGQRSNYERTIDSVWQPFCIVTPNTIERLPDAADWHFFIGGYSCDNGYHLYMDRRDGKVYLCSRKSVKPLHRWNSFPELVVEESSRLARLFDESGREIDPNQPKVTKGPSAGYEG